MLKPLGDRVVIEVLEAEEKQRVGLYYQTLPKEKPQSGKIVAVGSGRVLDNGTKEPLEVAEGDTVIFAKYSGTEVTYEGTDYLILRESDILAITK